MNSTPSAPTTLLPNPSSTLRGTWYRQLTCIPDQASLKVNDCQEIAVKVDIVDLGGAKVMKGVRFIPSPEENGSSLPLYLKAIKKENPEFYRAFAVTKCLISRIYTVVLMAVSLMLTVAFSAAGTATTTGTS